MICFYTSDELWEEDIPKLSRVIDQIHDKAGEESRYAEIAMSEIFKECLKIWELEE
jgi:hypothetical protein